ncbi:hypothetical protein ACPA9J_29475 [Pseudomonas aeruginosa]
MAGLKPKGILHNLNADFWPQREVPERVQLRDQPGKGRYLGVP